MKTCNHSTGAKLKTKINYKLVNFDMLNSVINILDSTVHNRLLFEQVNGIERSKSNLQREKSHRLLKQFVHILSSLVHAVVLSLTDSELFLSSSWMYFLHFVFSWTNQSYFLSVLPKGRFHKLLTQRFRTVYENSMKAVSSQTHVLFPRSPSCFHCFLGSPFRTGIR